MMIPLLKLETEAKPRAVGTTRSLLGLTHDLLALSALVFAVVQLAVLPNIALAFFMFFIPPMIAGGLLLLNRSDPFILAACRLFLSMIAIAVMTAEVTLALPVLKPQFPGLPPLADRILCAYFVAYGLFLWILCPGYVLTHWLRHWWNEQPKHIGRTLFLLTAWTCWVGMMLTLAVGLVLCRSRFF